MILSSQFSFSQYALILNTYNNESKTIDKTYKFQDLMVLNNNTVDKYFLKEKAVNKEKGTSTLLPKTKIKHALFQIASMH